MRLLNGEVFFGLLLIVAGVVFLLRYTFNLNIPVFRTLLAFAFIYLGVVLLFGGTFNSKQENLIIFDNKQVEYMERYDEYNIIFADGRIDLSGMVSLEKNKKIEVNVIFASGEIYIDPDIPVIIKAETVFGETVLPRGQSNNFGTLTYQSPGAELEPVLQLETNVVFGQLKITEVNDR